MKALIVIALAATFATAHAEDRLGRSKKELEELKTLNASKTTTKLTDEQLIKIMAGKWTTGRHDYIYRANGTWSMLPEEPGGTRGKWSIANRVLDDGNGKFRILDATSQRVVVKNPSGPYPFCYYRIK